MRVSQAASRVILAQLFTLLTLDYRRIHQQNTLCSPLSSVTTTQLAAEEKKREKKTNSTKITVRKA